MADARIVSKCIVSMFQVSANHRGFRAYGMGTSNARFLGWGQGVQNI